ncbi:MAG: hypothetical protein ACXU8U_11465 [Asticcacaulis sp.]
MGEVVSLRKPAVAVMGPIVKVALVMFVLVQASAFAYGVFFGVFSLGPLTALMQEYHVDQALALEGRFLQLTFAPLTYALLTALSPLVGWWVYSRVETGAQAKVMWGGAALFAVLSIVFNMALTGAMVANPLLLLLGILILVFYIVFFMGLGFIPAQLLKFKL